MRFVPRHVCLTFKILIPCTTSCDFTASTTFATCRLRKRLKAHHAHKQKQARCLRWQNHINYWYKNLCLYSLVISKNWAATQILFSHFPWTCTNCLFLILEQHKARTKRRQHKVASPTPFKICQTSITKTSHVCSILLESDLRFCIRIYQKPDLIRLDFIIYFFSTIIFELRLCIKTIIVFTQRIA